MAFALNRACMPRKYKLTPLLQKLGKCDAGRSRGSADEEESLQHRPGIDLFAPFDPFLSFDIVQYLLQGTLMDILSFVKFLKPFLEIMY